MTERTPPGRGWLSAAGAAAFLYFVALATGSEAMRLLAKPLPAAALAVWALRGHAPGSRAIALGLGLSALADAVIEASFPAGLTVFLLAHLAYLLGFLADCREPAVPRALPCALYGFGMYAVIGSGLGSLRVPVAVYTIVICAMVWRAAARVAHAGRPTLGEWAGLLGAVLFAISDSIIAWNRFVWPLAWAPAAIILLYWLGQTGIAASARRP